MSVEKYRAKVTAVGEFAAEFIDEGVLVFFGAAAPEELQEVAVIHDRSEPQAADIAPGDTIKLGDTEFPVLAVGPVANENIKNLGHIVIKFNGLKTPEMDGDITVPEAAIPEITVGLELVITG